MSETSFLSLREFAIIAILVDDYLALGIALRDRKHNDEYTS